MDGAAGRVSLRGMGLLHRNRERRERDAMAEVARRVEDARRAAAAARQAEHRAAEQRRAWREREHEVLLAMAGIEASPGRLADHWAEMDQSADEAVRLQGEREAAAAEEARAGERVAEAQDARRRAARLVQKGSAVIGRIRHWQERAAEAAEQAEGEDDAIRRHAAGRNR